MNRKINYKMNVSVPMLTHEFKMQFDGCSKGNPGLSGCGAVIYHYNKEIWSKQMFVGVKETNNVAEYNGLLLGLQGAIHLKIKNLFVEGDSKIIIKQMKGEYKVNANNLLSLWIQAKELEKYFDSIDYHHIYREHNQRADELSNLSVISHLISSN